MTETNEYSVSVIIPVYNVENYLRPCVDSVLQQTYGDFECILVDDGSTDQSGIICDEYEKTDGRVRVIHQENIGLSGARNTGIKHAIGKYVYFVDSDDCICEDLLETVVTIAEEKNAKMVMIDLQYVENDFLLHTNKKITTNSIEPVKIYEFGLTEALYNLDRDNRKISWDIRLTTSLAWTKLYRREIFDEILFDESVLIHEDQMIAHRAIIAAGGMVFCTAKKHLYRKRDGSLMKVGWTPKRLMMVECYRDRYDAVKELNPTLKDQPNLLNYVYERFLICGFKNYLMCMKKLSGEEEKKYRNQLMVRIKEIMQLEEWENLSMKKKIFFMIFTLCPSLVGRSYIAVKM